VLLTVITLLTAALLLGESEMVFDSRWRKWSCIRSRGTKTSRWYF